MARSYGQWEFSWICKVLQRQTASLSVLTHDSCCILRLAAKADALKGTADEGPQERLERFRRSSAKPREVHWVPKTARMKPAYCDASYSWSSLILSDPFCFASIVRPLAFYEYMCCHSGPIIIDGTAGITTMATKMPQGHQCAQRMVQSMHSQRSFQVLVKGGLGSRYSPNWQYTTYIPGIYCLLGELYNPYHLWHLCTIYLLAWWWRVVQIGFLRLQGLSHGLVQKETEKLEYFFECLSCSTKISGIDGANCIPPCSYRFEDREVDNLCCLVGRLQTPLAYNFESPYEGHCHHQLSMVFSQSYTYSWILRDLFVLNLYSILLARCFPLVLRISFIPQRQEGWLKWSKTTLTHIYADYSFPVLLWESFWSYVVFIYMCFS